jgi:putative phosphoribosyl transferase
MSAGAKFELQDIECKVDINIGEASLEGDLVLPANPKGIVLFAHGSGSSRFSSRNQHVARILQSRGMATLLFDLLTAKEESVDRATSEFRFNIPLLAARLCAATLWTLSEPMTEKLAQCYFGASTGAAAALMAAAELPEKVVAVVSRGGRPDLASGALGSVKVPTLLIVGGSDQPVLQLNRRALTELGCADKRLTIIPGASHLFEEPGALEEVARVAADWFETRLVLAADQASRLVTPA